MNRSVSFQSMLFSELALWLAIAVVGLFFLYPLTQTLKFGFDLKGGTYLTLNVHTEKAVEAELIEHMQAGDEHLKMAGVIAPTSQEVKDGAIHFTFATPANANTAMEEMRVMPEAKRFKSRVDGNMVLVSFVPSVAEAIKNEAVERDISVLRTRVQGIDPRSIEVMRKGESGVIVELPDVEDPQQAEAMIGKAAQLEFRLAESGRPASSRQEIEYKFDGGIPIDKEILPGEGGYYLVQRYAEVTGRMLKSAQHVMDQSRGIPRPAVSFELDAIGAKKFGQLTAANIGKYLAIVIDGRVVSAPILETEIPSGKGQITLGGGSLDEAEQLAALLRSGSFVAPVTFEERRHVGPALGAQSIRQGLMSCLVGLCLLFVFSLFYYKLSGLFAFCALLYNLFLILFGLLILKQPLTLPGIGGMVLTVGMAIDASVLIFEHIKEELAKGLGVREAIDRGFSDATTVILDGNITTLIVGVVLYYFGTGPIQGFAITMIFGIIATLITGLFFLRSIFKFVLQNFRIRTLSI